MRGREEGPWGDENGGWGLYAIAGDSPRGLYRLCCCELVLLRLRTAAAKGLKAVEMLLETLSSLYGTEASLT